MTVKTFTEPGRGRKKCPAAGCPHYVAAVTKKCPCGHEFVRGVKPTPTARKVAAKLATAAGTQRTKSKSKTEPEPQQPVLPAGGVYPRTRRGGGILRTAVPAGACPAKLKSTDKAEVYAWIEKVLQAVENDRHQLQITAVKYYAREFYDISDDFKATPEKPSKHQIVCGHIDSYWAEEGGEPDTYDEDDGDFELADDPQPSNDPPESADFPDHDEADDDNFEFED